MAAHNIPSFFDADGSLLRAPRLDPLIIGFSGTCKWDSPGGTHTLRVVFLNGNARTPLLNPATSNFELNSDPIDEAIYSRDGPLAGLGHSTKIPISDLFQKRVAKNVTPTKLLGFRYVFRWLLSVSKIGRIPIMAPTTWPGFPSSIQILFRLQHGISRFHLFSRWHHALQRDSTSSRGAWMTRYVRLMSQEHCFLRIFRVEFTGNPGQTQNRDNTVGSSFGSRNPALIGDYEIRFSGTNPSRPKKVGPTFHSRTRVGPLDPPPLTTPRTNLASV